MISRIVNTTIQACLLSATSCIIGQAITAYKSNESFSIDLTQVLQFIVYTIINCPPNFLWQTLLEHSFPSTHLVPTNTAIRAASSPTSTLLDEKPTQTNSPSTPLTEPRLSLTNTLLKFLLDQTIGAAFNTVLFSLTFATFRGATITQAIQISKQDFWGLVKAGWRLWPLVSAVNFSVVRSVAGRQLVGSLAGMVWGVYLSLVAGGGEVKGGKEL